MTGHYFNLNTLILILLTGQNYGPRFCFEYKLIFNINDVVNVSLSLFFYLEKEARVQKLTKRFIKTVSLKATLASFLISKRMQVLSLRRLLGEKREKVMWWGRDCFCCRNPQLCTNSESTQLERYHTVLAYLIKPNVLTVTS